MIIHIYSLLFAIFFSSEIIKWARQNQHPSYDKFSKAKMEETRFLDLKIQLGVPYMYQHQGNCEHIITFLDIRLVLLL